MRSALRQASYTCRPCCRLAAPLVASWCSCCSLMAAAMVLATPILRLSSSSAPTAPRRKCWRLLAPTALATLPHCRLRCYQSYSVRLIVLVACAIAPAPAQSPAAPPPLQSQRSRLSTCRTMPPKSPSRYRWSRQARQLLLLSWTTRHRLSPTSHRRRSLSQWFQALRNSNLDRS